MYTVQTLEAMWNVFLKTMDKLQNEFVCIGGTAQTAIIKGDCRGACEEIHLPLGQQYMLERHLSSSGVAGGIHGGERGGPA